MTNKRKTKRRQPKRRPTFKSDAVLDALCVQYTMLGKTGWWWIFEDSLKQVARSLLRNNFAVLDHFLGDNDAQLLRHELHTVYQRGDLPETKQNMEGCPKMEPGALAGGVSGNNLSYKIQQVRGDYVAWFSGQEQACGWTMLPKYLQKIDTFVSELSQYVPELRGVTVRSKAMATCYPGKGARYVKHCDNVSLKSNGRKLTVLLYLNMGWKQGDGGELAVFESARGKTKLDTNDPEGPPSSDTPHVCDIEPLGDRLVVFWSDERVPHEVLATNQKRFAVTTWFFDAKERETATQKQQNPELIEKEQQRIKQEIEKFETQYQTKAEMKIDEDGVESRLRRGQGEGGESGSASAAVAQSLEESGATAPPLDQNSSSTPPTNQNSSSPPPTNQNSSSPPPTNQHSSSPPPTNQYSSPPHQLPSDPGIWEME